MQPVFTGSNVLEVGLVISSDFGNIYSISLLESHVGPWRPGLDPSGVIFILFFVMRAWGDAPWSQLRPREVSHRSVKCGGVGGLRASIDACQKLFGFQLFWFCPQKTFPFTATSLDVPLFVRATPGRHAVQQRGRARVRGRTGAITRERPDSRAFPATDAPTVVNPDENLTLRSAPPPPTRP